MRRTPVVLCCFTVVSLLTTSIECNDISMLTRTEKYLQRRTTANITHLIHKHIHHNMAKAHEIGTSRVEKLTFHTFHHVQYNGCFKHMNYRLSMSNKPCHTIFFSFRMVGLQSWVLRVTKSSRFLRYPQYTSHFLCFYHVHINTYNLL